MGFADMSFNNLLVDTPLKGKVGLLCSQLAIFISAFLLFEIEPISGKILTPLVGGTSEVWIVCLVFFQLVVLSGYLLTYVLARMSLRNYIIAYSSLFLVSLFWARVPPTNGWALQVSNDPVQNLLCSLTSHLAIPCIVLSSVSGTIQVWQARIGSKNPYRLYCLSNAGSLGALLLYPLLIEPFQSVTNSLNVWQNGYYALFAVVLIIAATLYDWQQVPAPMIFASTKDADKIPIGSVSYWLFFSALGTAALTSFTSYITSDIAPVPVLWILPLAIYLLSFIIPFSGVNCRIDVLSKVWVPLLVAEQLCTSVSPLLVVLINFALLFVLCMVCNLKLLSKKPPIANLPAFYFILSIGGAIGTILVALVSPIVLSVAADRSIVILIFTAYLLLLGGRNLPKQRFILRIALVSAMSAMALLWCSIPAPDVLYRARNFFGSVTVKQEANKIVLYHGRVAHGEEDSDPVKANTDTCQYFPPVSLAFSYLHAMHTTALKVGVIGLGAGCMAAELHRGDRLTYFEIDPKVEKIARHSFHYLAKTQGAVDVRIGDGRVLLNQSPEEYDAILVDAFSGDAVPSHLLTLEAMDVYFRHLKPSGILIFHVTNAYLDLLPVIGNVAQAKQLFGCQMVGAANSKYAVLSRKTVDLKDFIGYARVNGASFSQTKVSALPVRQDLSAWSDDCSNLISALKLK